MLQTDFVQLFVCFYQDSTGVGVIRQPPGPLDKQRWCLLCLPPFPHSGVTKETNSKMTIRGFFTRTQKGVWGLLASLNKTSKSYNELIAYTV